MHIYKVKEVRKIEKGELEKAKELIEIENVVKHELFLVANVQHGEKELRIDGDDDFYLAVKYISWKIWKKFFSKE